MLDEAGTWNEAGQMDVNLETIILLETVKRYPRKELDLFKDVNYNGPKILDTKKGDVKVGLWDEKDILQSSSLKSYWKF
jgi:hypothetical protein